MTEERNCYIHNIPTRLSCSVCNKPICPKCAVNAAVGYRCKECGKRIVTHIEKVSMPRLLLGSIAGMITGVSVGYLWIALGRYGLLISLAGAYFVGFCIYYAMTKIIGYKIGRRMQVIAAIIAIISILFNPIILYLRYGGGFNLEFLISSLATIGLMNPIRILATFFAAWAASRHFNFNN